MKWPEFKLQVGNIGSEDDDNDNGDDDDDDGCGNDDEGGGCRQHAVLRENSSKVW